MIAGSTLVLHRAIRNMITLAKMAAGNRDSDGDEHPGGFRRRRRAMAASSRAPCGVLTLMDAGWNLAGVIA